MEKAGEVIGVKGADRGRLQKVSPRLTCYEYPSLYVVEEGVKDRVGSNILIKYRNHPSETFSCVYEKEEGDFEIRNEWAEYFMGKSSGLIFLDSGTGPCPRDLIVISVEKRKKLYNTSYCGPVAVREGKELFFWKESGAATRENCPEYDRIKADTLFPYIEERFVLFLETLELRGTGEKRCAAGQ